MTKFGLDINIEDKRKEGFSLIQSETGFISKPSNIQYINKDDEDELNIPYLLLEGTRYTNILAIMERMKKLTEEHYNNEFVLVSFEYDEITVKKLYEIMSKNINEYHNKSV